MTAPAPPRHIAIIMDGNGRWALERGLARIEGHREGAKAVREIVTYARELGVRYLTLYAFSSENWGRPSTEVSGLMELLAEYLVDERPTLLKNGIQLHTIGAIERLPAHVRVLLDGVKKETQALTDMRLSLALSYGGRDELLRAVTKLAHEVDRGELDPDDIDEAALTRCLDTADMPDPDLLIRTSGEQRISNFLLWQLAYTELYFTDAPWPAFNRALLDEAIAAFHSRQRRFGLIGAQVSESG